MRLQKCQNGANTKCLDHKNMYRLHKLCADNAESNKAKLPIIWMKATKMSYTVPAGPTHKLLCGDKQTSA